MRTHLHPLPLAVMMTVGAAVLLAGCSPAAPAWITVMPLPTRTAPAQNDVLSEREAFISEQQLAPGSKTLAAVTPAQKAFIEQQRASAPDGRMTPQTETLLLASTLDACETAILNSHDVDADILRGHVATSPIFATLAADDLIVERGMATLMITGMGYLCPDDAPQWRTAFAEVYGQEFPSGMLPDDVRARQS
jgi:hypothetical protein